MVSFPPRDRTFFGSETYTSKVARHAVRRRSGTIFTAAGRLKRAVRPSCKGTTESCVPSFNRSSPKSDNKVGPPLLLVPTIKRGMPLRQQNTAFSLKSFSRLGGIFHIQMLRPNRHRPWLVVSTFQVSKILFNIIPGRWEHFVETDWWDWNKESIWFNDFLTQQLLGLNLQRSKTAFAKESC